MSGFKRARADFDALTAAGLTAFGKDETYFSTAVTNVSLFDASSKHGLPATYSQSRTIQIIPNTARSEVGVAYAEIHTKTLPIFQPQVKIGTDPNELIYEVGLSANWEGCLLNPAVYGSRMQSLLATDSANDALINGTNRQTFQNNGSVYTFMTDSYGNTFQVNLINGLLKHTLLSNLFDAWRLAGSPLYVNTPLIPVCVPSVYQRMLVMQPLLDSTPAVIGAYIAVESADGFKIGDRIRVFGSVDSAATTVDLSKYTTILSICLYSDLVVAGAIANPTSNDPSVLTRPCLVVDNSSTTGLNLASTVRRSGGYVINCMTDASGGRIQLLTDEFEFRPLTLTPTACTANALTCNLPTSYGLATGSGFLRTGWNGVVELRATTEPKLNGLYKVTSFSGTTSIVLRPLNRVLDGSFSGTAVLKLAPNGYTFSTGVKNVNDYSEFNHIVGITATETDVLVQPSYPPVATEFTQSWTRAYTPKFSISSYRTLKWVTQDIAQFPSPPTIQQDFGDGSTSTYYNVYNMQTFLNECVNPALVKCVNEGGVLTTSLSSRSLQAQLNRFAQSYIDSFRNTNASFAYIPTFSYSQGDTIIYQNKVYIAMNDSTININPGSDNTVWFLLGDAKVESSTLTGNLVFSSSTGGFSFTCVGTSMLPERVFFSSLPLLKTLPPRFEFESLTGLFSFTADPYSFGSTYPYVDVKNPDGSYTQDIRNINYRSWGYKNACSGVDNQGGEESFIMESNSSFKFLMDNFQCSSIEYINPVTNDTLVYWLWPCYGEQRELYNTFTRRFTQASESLSSCTNPVQSIVITSRTIPVVPSLASPPTYISDFNVSAANLNGVTGDTDNIIGEFSIPPGALTSMRSVIRYQPEQTTMYSLQSTKTFKQLDYNVYYRHRVTQKLVPLILSNYGNVNIKFVFKPT